jgi:hypothetical protein
MEVLIILVVVAVIGSLFYLSLPSTKFNNALRLFSGGNISAAIEILNEIFDKHIDAPAKLAECNLRLGQQSSIKTEKIKYFSDVLAIRQRVTNTESATKLDKIEAVAFLEISEIQYADALGDIDKLQQNIKYIDSVNNGELNTSFEALKTKHLANLAECYFTKGTEKEKSGKYAEAIQEYIIAKGHAITGKNSFLHQNSIVRTSICQLKSNKDVELPSLSNIRDAKIEYLKDLYYRYAIKLLKGKKFTEAEILIGNNLNYRSAELSKLTSIIELEKKNIAYQRVEELNVAIERMYSNSLSGEDIRRIYDTIDTIAEEVKSFDQQLAEKISGIKQTLFSRLLTHYIAVEQYENAIDLIEKIPKFWEDSDYLKNIGICCLGLVDKGLLTEKNYRSVISGWLTAVYSDRIILKSLEHTLWDDNYTFSLAESIGSKYSQHEEIPENVNYDAISDTNISIGATQRELLHQFETILQKQNHSVPLSNAINSFYENEKEAIQNTINIIEDDIVFATPHFAKSYGINNQIIQALDNDYRKYENEDALKAGIPFIKDSNSTVVYQYYFANDIIDKVSSAIKNEKSGTIKNLNTQDNKRWIDKFESVRSIVEDKLFNAISFKISENDENEKLIPVMEECIAFSSQKEKLKYQYANYVVNYCIDKVNNDEMDNFKALSLVRNAYLNSPNNPKVCKNFITLIHFNLMDILNDRTRRTNEIYTLLDQAKTNMSHTYKQHCSELRNVRKEVLQQLAGAGVDISLFDDNNPLAQLHSASGRTLTAEGLKMKRILNYLKELGN